MFVRRLAFCALLTVMISSALPSAQTGGTVSYKVDGKAFAFKDGRLEYYKGDGYISFVGLHETNTPDEMPTSFSWHEIVPTDDKKGKEIKEYLATLDSGDESKMVIRLKIDNFGPAGSLVNGTFSGKLFDEDGKLHEITDGVFSVPRKDMD